MENGFQIGDRVVVVRTYDQAEVGMTGEIVAIDTDGSIGVCFDESFFGGHSLGGRCPPNRGHWVNPGDIQQIESLVPMDAAALDALLLGV